MSDFNSVGDRTPRCRTDRWCNYSLVLTNAFWKNYKTQKSPLIRRLGNAQFATRWLWQH